MLDLAKIVKEPNKSVIWTVSFLKVTNLSQLIDNQ